MIEKNPSIKSLLIKSAGDTETAGERDQRAHKALWTIWQTLKQTIFTSRKHSRSGQERRAPTTLQELHPLPWAPPTRRVFSAERNISDTQRGVSLQNREVGLPLPLAKVQLLQESTGSPGGTSSSRKLVNKDSTRNKNGQSARKRTLSRTTRTPLSLQLSKEKLGEGLERSSCWHRPQKNKYYGTGDKVVRRPDAGNWNWRKGNLSRELIYHWNYLPKGLWCVLQHGQISKMVFLKNAKFSEWDKYTQRLLTCLSLFSQSMIPISCLFFWSLPHVSHIIFTRILSSTLSIFLTTFFAPKSCKMYLFGCCHVDYHLFHMPASTHLERQISLIPVLQNKRWEIANLLHHNILGGEDDGKNPTSCPES